jgi:Zn-dependent peptidase ImmA (M78 family)
LKIPDKIKIKGVEFEVMYSELEDKLFGDYKELPPVIRINKNAGKDFQEITLLHEALHILRSDIKEQWVRDFAWDLWQFLKDNNLFKE